ncbi:MAG: Wzz/FepE/Etk N-terminal domain-containing protein, partial [Candidatus Acidiferrum sp.]
MTRLATRSQVQQRLPEDGLSLDVPSSSFKETTFAHLNFLWGRRRTILRAAAVGLVLGALLAFSLSKRYESTTRLMPPDEQSSSGLAMLAALTTKTTGTSSLSPLAGDLLGAKNSSALFIGILRSNTVEDRLIQRFNLRHIYKARYEEGARHILAANTSIDEDRKSGIIFITVTDTDPKRAMAIANAYVEELNQLVAELSTSSAHRERVFLEGRLIGVKRDLDQASVDFSQFASKNKTIDIKEEARAMLQGAATIEGQLIAAESELKGLQALYTDSNVRVRAVQGRVAELRSEMAKLGGSTSEKVPSGASSTDSTFPSLQNLPLLGVTYADLYRRVEIQEAVYEALTKQYELAKVEEAKETPSVKVLDPASMPERKTFPPRGLIILAAALLAMCATAAFLIGKQRWDAISPDDSGKLFAQQVFQSFNAMTPWAAPNGSRVRAWTNRVWVKLRSNGKGLSEERNG